MAEQKGRKARLEEQAKAAERFLVLRNFEEADRISRYVLQQALYVPGSTSEQQRAAFVFLQALYELERFSEARAALQEHYGGLDCIDHDVLMLWTALALDAGMHKDAAAAMACYLDKQSSVDVQRVPALSAQQIVAAVHMYAIEVLGREARQYAEAEAWLQGATAQKLLAAGERARLLEELRALQPGAEGAPARPQTPAHGPERPPPLLLRGDSADHAKTSAAAAAAAAASGKEPRTASHPLWQVAGGGKASGAPYMRHSDSTRSTAASGTGREQAPGLNAAAGGSAAAAAVTGHNSTASQGEASWSAALHQRLAGWWQQVEGWEALEGVSQTHMAAAAAGAVVLLYAGFAERRALAQGMRWVGGGFFGSIYEVARLATTLNPNPVAAAIATRR